MDLGNLQRITAFTDNPAGGNPAGVWVGEEAPPVATMQAIAAAVGYSETAFVTPASGVERTVRYFTPEVEVPFCGHATIAAGFVLGARGTKTYNFRTPSGDVPVQVTEAGGRVSVSLTSVTPRQEAAPDGLVEHALALLNWGPSDTDPALPPVLAYAGIWHLVLSAATRERLANLDYDYDGLAALMREHNLATLQLVWRQHETLYHSRNPAPAVGIVEDPATGSAAAALGGYLRDAGLIVSPARIEVRQGEDMGRPSKLLVDIPATGGIVVSGTAVRLD